MKRPEIVIIDDNLPQGDPLIVKLEMAEYNVKLFQHSQDGLDYILNNMQKEQIVILDINFASGELNGHEVIKKIREQNKLIPVIIWSAKTGEEVDFTDFVNNHALYYVKQTGNTPEIIKSIEDAYHYLQLDIATAMENWFERQDDQEQILSIGLDGKRYSAKDLIKEIRMQTEEGRRIEKSIINLTIDLLFRNKESV